MRKRNQQSNMCANGEKMIRVNVCPCQYGYFLLLCCGGSNLDCVVTGKRV